MTNAAEYDLRDKPLQVMAGTAERDGSVPASRDTLASADRDGSARSQRDGSLAAAVRQVADRLAVEAGGYQVHEWDAGYRAAQEEIARELLLVLADMPPRGPESLPDRLDAVRAVCVDNNGSRDQGGRS